MCSNLTIIYQANPRFGGKMTSFVAVLVQNTCVYYCRPVLHHLNFNVSLLSRFVKPGIGIIDGFLLQPHCFLLFWRKIRGWLGIIWQGWTRNLSLVPLLRLMYLSDEIIMSIYWYYYHVQSCIIAFLVEKATKLLHFATK